jgi:hypothetical protein
MPNDKPPTVSFNQWLSLQRTGPYAAIAAAWKTTRGRLTRQTVIDRAGPDGGAAWDAYCLAVGVTNPPLAPTSV